MLKHFFKRINDQPLSQKEQGLFAERLALLQGAPMSLPESIAIISRAFGKKRIKYFVEIENSLNDGASFELTLSKSSLGFSRMFIMAARIGERSGTLSESLAAAAGRIERSRAVKGGLVSALTYPAIIFFASAGIIAFLVFFIMPKIMPTIKSLNVPLPWVTVFFMSLSYFLATEWWKIILATAIFVGGFIFLYKKVALFKSFIQQIIMRIPLVAKTTKAHILSEIFDTIYTLVSAGCPFIEAVGESSAFIGFIPYRKSLSRAVKEMQTGSDFSSSLRTYSRLFPELAVDSLAIGERTGNIEAVLSQMSRYYARELGSSLSGMAKMIEPALMIFVGIIVGAAALSIVLPIYEISQHISG